MGRLRSIVTTPSRAVAPNPYLTALQRAAVTIAKRVYVQLQAPEPLSLEAEQLSSDSLLTRCEKLIDRHDRQYELLSLLKNAATGLCGLVSEMPNERPPRYAQLVELADRVIDQTDRQSGLDGVLPQPGLPYFEVIAENLAIDHAAVFINGVASARLIAWLGEGQLQSREHLRHVVIAALLQDVGCLKLAKPGSVSLRKQQEAKQAYQKHPLHSAAMIGRIYQPPTPIARLAARHHERLDASGYPQRLSGLQFNESLRLLITAVEQISLMRAPIDVEQFVHRPEDRGVEIARELSSLALGGQLDADWVELAAKQLDVSKIPATEETEITASADETEHTLHGEHAQTPEPHYLQIASEELTIAPTDTEYALKIDD